MVIQRGNQPSLTLLDDLLAVMFNRRLVVFLEKLLCKCCSLVRCQGAIIARHEGKHVRFIHPIVAIEVDTLEDGVEAAPNHVV